MVVPNMDSAARDQVLKLMEEKDKIEREIAQLGTVLETNKVDMFETLVDENGFPRNDIDVYQVRHARNRIICLQNDHKSIMKQIEKGLHALHSSQKNTSSDTDSPSSSSSEQPNTSANGLPALVTNGHAEDRFVANELVELRVSPPKTMVKVNFVSSGSPAEEAGIIVDDEIIEFGSLNASNFRNLNQIAEIVQHSINSRINVKVLRKSGMDDNVVNISLTPHTWSGRGLLGCNIVPVETCSL